MYDFFLKITYWFKFGHLACYFDEAIAIELKFRIISCALLYRNRLGIGIGPHKKQN